MISKIKIASYLRSFAIVYSIATERYNDSFYNNFLYCINNNFIDISENEFNDMIEITLFTLISKNLSIMSDSSNKSIPNIQVNNIDNIFINKNVSNSFTVKEIIQYIRNAICHNTNNDKPLYWFIKDNDNKIKLHILLRDTIASTGDKKGQKVPFEVEFDLPSFLNFQNIFELTSFNKVFGIECDYSKTDINDIINTLYYKKTTYNQLSSKRNKEILSILFDPNTCKCDSINEIENQLKNNTNNESKHDLSNEQKDTIRNNIHNWSDIYGIYELLTIEHEALKSIPNGYTKTRELTILIYILLNIEHDKSLRSIINNDIIEELKDKNSFTYKKFSFLNLEDFYDKMNFILNVLDCPYQCYLLYSLYFDYFLENVIDDDIIVIENIEYNKNKLRNSFVHGRWYVSHDGNYELYDCPNGIKNEFDYNFHKTISFNDLFNTIDNYYFSSKINLKLTKS